jgi:hypothetical protein
MFKYILLALFILSININYAQKLPKGSPAGEYVEIRVYHTTDDEQVKIIEGFIQASLLPTLQKNKFDRIGVFTAIANDTAKDKRVYVIIPFKSLLHVEQLGKLNEQLVDSSVSNSVYVKAPYNHPAYTRIETILLKNFTGMPLVKAPALKGDLNDRVYELRSYESASEAIHLNKISMFHSGEIDLFNRLGFNAVFYGQVLSGCRMPNLMYMTSFSSKASRDEHWKIFSSDPVWKSMSGDVKYQNNVSKIDIVFLRPATYSQL